ncbi:oxidoreductase [Erythrobacter sp. SG61-1L]|uniref:SDR family NAD(P)-dependent oxidoreductase n=1 Tax=Erythrobacter sp. SG61-1L TaxID=1603897 RepID=UPI0006C933D5|nr:SDR family oxidoreductase [Erythrobacter sp. SG61-1L]KPL67078.1 oxidoreductase [Erythrobacter sp. SG61-1L]
MTANFTGMTALVTGTASGIGAASARWLDAQGIERLILVDRDADGLNALELSCVVERHAGDVSDPAFWQALEPQIGRLDHAVVNAGIAAGAPIAEESFEQWRRIMSVNLDGAFLTLATALRLIAKGGNGGGVVLLSSVTGVKPMAGTGAYGSSKAALAHLAKIAALENAGAGIRVNAIAPGGVDTPIWDSDANFRAMAADMGRDAAIAGFASGTPLKRFATPDEIAATIGFLLSAQAANITGVVLSSDGGLAL